MVSSEWFCQVMGSEVGPLSQRQLVDMVRHHRLNPEDLVRRNNSSWVPAFQVRGLFEAAAKPAEQVSQSDTSPPEAESPVPKETESAATENNGDSSVATEVSQDDDEAISSPRCSDDANDWFCIATGEKRGPLCFDELKALARDGTLRDRDRVWRASWPKFRQAAEVDGLDVN